MGYKNIDRSLHISSARAVILAALTLATVPIAAPLARSGRAHAHPRCRVGGGKVLARNREAVVIDVDEGNRSGYGNETVYGCLVKRGRPIDLAEASSNSQGFLKIDLAGLAGRYVAIWSRGEAYADPTPPASSVDLFDLRAVRRPHGVARALASFAGAGTFVLSRRGVAAQLVAPRPAYTPPAGAPAGGPPASGAQPGTVTVFDARGLRSVDTGNVAGLALVGLTVSWTHDGAARKLTLRARH